MWRHHFPHYIGAHGVVLSCSWQLFLWSVVQHGRNENIQDIMHILVTCNFKKDQTNSNREKSGDIDFLDNQGQLNVLTVVESGGYSDSSKLMVVLVTCKNEDDLPQKRR